MVKREKSHYYNKMKRKIALLEATRNNLTERAETSEKKLGEIYSTYVNQASIIMTQTKVIAHLLSQLENRR